MGDKLSTYDRHVKLFKEGTAEDYCNHCAVLEELYNKLAYKKFVANGKHDTTVKDLYGVQVKKTDREDHVALKKTALFLSTL